MSNFQTNTLFGAILIAIFWLIFCINIIAIDAYVWVLWAISSLCIGLRIGWNQKWMWFLGWILSMLTALWFFFSIIPVYKYNASLSAFYASQVPSIVCDSSIEWSILIDTMKVSMTDVCKRWWFPLLSEQMIDIQTTQPVLINLAMGNSTTLQPAYKWVIKRTIENWIPLYTLSNPTGTTNQQTTNQYMVKQDFQQAKKEYLQKNYPRKREYAPSITKIAIRKMRLLSLIDRSYKDKVSSLEFYMNEIE